MSAQLAGGQESSLLWEFSLFLSVSLASSAKFKSFAIAAQGPAANWSLGGEKKIVLCIACFAYSSVIVVFPLLYH